MDNSISLPSGPILWGKAQALNEKTVAGLGFLVFFLVVAGSIAARLSLEATAIEKVVRARPVAAAERTLAMGDVLVPVTLSVKLKNGKATLRGTVPDEKSHDTVVNRAKEIYGRSNVEDKLSVESGIIVTPWFDSVLKWFPPRVEQSWVNVSPLIPQICPGEARSTSNRIPKICRIKRGLRAGSSDG